MEFSNHGSVTRMDNRITLRSYSSKWVNNQMEVNDRPKHNGGDDENTIKASEADDNAFTMVIYRKLVHFLMSLNSGGNIFSLLMLIFNELELHVKTARSSHIIRMSHLRCHFCGACPLQSFASDPFFMQVRKQPILRV